MALALHGGGVDRQDDGVAVAPADVCRGLDVRRPVNVLPGAWLQTMLQDGADRLLRGAMVEDGGRRLDREAEVDRQGVALTGPDAAAGLVEGIALLFVLGDDLVELRATEGPFPRGSARVVIWGNL